MSQPRVVSVQVVERRFQREFDGMTYVVPGELVSLADGSKWFHPYNGGAPREEDPARKSKLI